MASFTLQRWLGLSCCHRDCAISEATILPPCNSDQNVCTLLICTDYDCAQLAKDEKNLRDYAAIQPRLTKEKTEAQKDANLLKSTKVTQTNPG